MVRRYLHVVQLAEPRELSALGEAPIHCHVELQDLNRLLLQHSTAAIAGDLTLAARERDAGLLRQQLQQPPVILPLQRLLQPPRVQGLQEACTLNGRGKIPRAVDIHHEVLVRSNGISDDSHPVDVLFQLPLPALCLETCVALIKHHLHLVPQFRLVFPVAVVTACGVDGHLIPETAEQPVKGQTGGLAHDVPARNVHRGARPDNGLARPALLARSPAGREAEQLLVQSLRSKGVLADDQVC
mmetsp:Transcript_35242/g.112079  ORF Transcript_35242/g.112079 Transcript_35242/m.112079 type:complete len:242 (-) Transcript_35242:275-1000(-)